MVAEHVPTNSFTEEANHFKHISKVAMELQVVSFLLRHQPYIPALSELGRKVSRFLGPSPNLSLSEACVYDSIALLDWIWDSSCTSIAERSSGWSLHNFLRSDNDYYKWEFAKGMQFVARGGNMKILECFFQHFEGCGVTTDIVDLAARNGHLEVLIYLQEHTTVVHENFPENWTGPGHYVCWGGDGIILACEEGHGNVAQWLVENWPHALSLEETETIIRSALAGGLMDLAQSLLPADRHIADYVTEFSHPLAFEMAVTSGRLKLDQYPNGAVHSFVKAGRLDLIKRVCKNLPRDDENLREILAIDEGDSYEWRLVIKEAIRRGDMHMVDWLVKHPIGQASLIAAKAAKTSLEFAIATTDTAMLQYLHNGDLLLAGDYMDGLVHAVQNGQLDAVQWFLLHAANLSNLEQYNLMDEAAKCGHLDILQFFHGSTSSIEEDFLRQIRLKGCSTEAMNDAATNGHLEMIQWLHANRSEGCTTKAMDGAAKGGHLEVIKWLYRNRSEGCTFEAIELAIVTGQLQVACWLRTHGYGQLEVDHWLMEFFVHFSPTEGKHFCPKRELEILLFLHVNYPHVIHVNS